MNDEVRIMGKLLRPFRHLSIRASFVILGARPIISLPGMPIPRLILSYPDPRHNNAAMDYGVLDYGDMNWLAVFCAGLAYWLLGAIWYSAIFSKMWRSAVEEHGVKVGQPHQGGMGIKLIVTLVCNLIAALVLARVIHQVGHHMDLLRGLKIGAGVGLAFFATALTMTYVWQSPPRRLWAIDAGYHIVGCTIMGAILAVWR